MKNIEDEIHEKNLEGKIENEYEKYLRYRKKKIDLGLYQDHFFNRRDTCNFSKKNHRENASLLYLNTMKTYTTVKVFLKQKKHVKNCALFL